MISDRYPNLILAVIVTEFVADYQKPRIRLSENTTPATEDPFMKHVGQVTIRIRQDMTLY